jgi:hypothetical protein
MKYVLDASVAVRWVLRDLLQAKARQLRTAYQNRSHESETFGSGQTQYFECEALSADHPEIQAHTGRGTGFPSDHRDK